MTPIEFFRRLTALPESTPLSLPHVAAMVEMLSGLLTVTLDASVPQQARATNEAQFAKWIGLPQDVVRSWRVAPEVTPIRYRLAAVVDGFLQHSLPLPESLDDAKDEDNRRAVIAWWAEAIPVLEVDSRLIGFFRSLSLESEPTNFHVLHVAIPADEPGDADVRAMLEAHTTQEMVRDVVSSLEASGDFARAVWSPSAKKGELVKAKKLFNAWKGRLIPGVLLQFLRSVVLHDVAFADEIYAQLEQSLGQDKNEKGAKKAARTYVSHEFRLAVWLFSLLVEHDLGDLDGHALLNAAERILKFGVAVNQPVWVRDGDMAVRFHGTSAHLLADTKGTTFSIFPIAESQAQTYNALLSLLLKAGLNVDLSNEDGLTAQDIADKVETDYGAGHSLFRRVVATTALRKKLNRDLNRKPAKPKSISENGKV